MGNVPHKSYLLVTEEQVKETLLADKGKDAELRSWKVVSFARRGDNYASVVASVETDYDINNTQQNVTYIVKLNPCRNFQDLNATNRGLFMKEAKFYSVLLPELNAVLEEAGKEPLRFPKYFNCNLENGKEQIYFEDLRVKGFKMSDRRMGMDVAHSLLVLKELARLHATSYILQSKSPNEFLTSKYDFLLKDWFTLGENTRDINLSVMKGSLNNAEELLKKIGGYDRAILWIKSLESKLEDILDSGKHSERFLCVNHGDCWNNNLLFRYSEDGEPIEVMLVDLQICRKSSLADDLNYLLYTSLPENVRKPNLSQFLSTYYTTYKDVLTAADFRMHFTEEELMVEFRNRNVLGVVFGMAIVPLTLIESDDVPETTGDEKFEQMKSNMKSGRVEVLENNPLVKTRFLAMFDEMIENGLIP